ncbi:dTDP-4-dehydrorhamnose reductase [Cytobacillus oceanisediminis]|uniref:dTDP-4-dehydrorhamnose reductase n=1 Tax=Cytobacillus oceanisediminis TaxID=665099 RepID=UPI001FB3431B|nr:dTDP-4-dehydrorhamnose reductase [Cytobacillus oceanisediminis]UOE55156.1 dTDP-4-dehydrorhamnose reductase [Cytobacillus oceanisediminis]
MKIIVTGAKGQLGTDVVLKLQEKGYTVYGYGRQDLDITNEDQLKNIFQSIMPDVVIHTAAHTKVDLAESEPDQAYLINSIGTRNVAVAAEKVGAKLVYISTDYVFDGSAKEPLHEFQSTNPIGIYGKSKLAGEHFVHDFHSKFFIVRTSWVYGKHGNNFVNTMLQLGKEMKEISVVADQVGCPTYTVDLADRIIDLIQTERYGVYHISNAGSCSWYEFAVEIFEKAKLDAKVIPCTTKDFPRPAPRPAYSVLQHMSLKLNGFNEMPDWRKSLNIFLNRLDNAK